MDQKVITFQADIWKFTAKLKNQLVQDSQFYSYQLDAIYG